MGDCLWEKKQQIFSNVLVRPVKSHIEAWETFSRGPSRKKIFLIFLFKMVHSGVLHIFQ